MKKLLSNGQMREADRYTIDVLGVSGEELMRRAGEGIAEEVVRILQERALKTVCVVCGGGNNGGDGYVCARILHERGGYVSVYACGDRLSADCEREKARYRGAYTRKIEGDVVVDCLFGTGLTRGIAGEAEEVVRQINSCGALVVSADIPSGLNGDNGKAAGAVVKADLTVAVAEYKLGHVLGDGPDLCGRVVKKDIGICADGAYAVMYGEEDLREFYPARRSNTHKGTYGCANLVAGSPKYRGAAALCSAAALRSGCGYVKLSACEEVKTSLVAAYPQVIYLDEPDFSADAIAVGMGCGVGARQYEIVARLIKNYRGKLILDADGLNVLSEYGVGILKEKSCDLLITPHLGEFSRLSGLTVGEITEDPVKFAQEFAEEFGVTVMLKSAATVVTDGKTTAVNGMGSTALAKGGSGDLLSGLICGNAARGLGLFQAAVVSAYVLGKSARLCSEEYTDYCTTADELLKNLPKAVKSLTTPF